MPNLPVIERNVPLPIRCSVRSYGVLIDLQAAIRALKDGESFVVDGETARSQALNVGNRLGTPVTTEVIKGEDRFRVWRKPKEGK